MKLFFILLFTGTQLLSYSQDNFPIRQKIYKVSVAHTTPKVSFGYLVDIKDSAILLTDMAASIRFNAIHKEDLITIPYGNIEVVSLKRKGSTGRGMLQGALIGLATGAITGLIMGDDPHCSYSQQDFYGIGTALCEAFRTTAGEKAVVIGSAGAVGGALIGGIIGTVARKRFIIRGNREKFKEMQMSVMDRMYGSRQDKK